MNLCCVDLVGNVSRLLLKTLYLVTNMVNNVFFSVVPSFMIKLFHSKTLFVYKHLLT